MQFVFFHTISKKTEIPEIRKRIHTRCNFIADIFILNLRKQD